MVYRYVRDKHVRMLAFLEMGMIDRFDSISRTYFKNFQFGRKGRGYDLSSCSLKLKKTFAVGSRSLLKLRLKLRLKFGRLIISGRGVIEGISKGICDLG
jgi:hypothetical protein